MTAPVEILLEAGDIDVMPDELVLSVDPVVVVRVPCMPTVDPTKRFLSEVVMVGAGTEVWLVELVEIGCWAKGDIWPNRQLIAEKSIGEELELIVGDELVEEAGLLSDEATIETA